MFTPPLRLNQPRTHDAWLLWAAVLMAALVALLWGAWRWQHSRQALQTEVATSATAAKTDGLAPQPTRAGVATDFVPTLSRQHDLPALLQAVRLLCNEHQAALQSLQVQPVAAEPGQLGRLELVLKAQGRYAGVKGLLAALSERYPAMTVPQLKLRSSNSGTPGVRELDVTLAFWVQPVDVVAGGARSMMIQLRQGRDLARPDDSSRSPHATTSTRYAGTFHALAMTKTLRSRTRASTGER